MILLPRPAVGAKRRGVHEFMKSLQVGQVCGLSRCTNSSNATLPADRQCVPEINNFPRSHLELAQTRVGGEDAFKALVGEGRGRGWSCVK